MTEELKTVDDLWTPAYEQMPVERVIPMNQLRQEAIKKIKQLRESLNDKEGIHPYGEFKLNDKISLYQDYEQTDITAVIDYIVWENNLIEEELK